MRRLSGMDAAFLYLETPTTHMQVQAVMLLDPSTVPGGYSFEKIKAHPRVPPAAAARVPAPARVRSLRPAPAGVVRRPRLRLRLPRPPHRGAGARDARSSWPTSSATSRAVPSIARDRSGSSGSSKASRTARSRSSRACTTRRSTACRVRACSRPSSISSRKPVDESPPADDWKPEHKPSDFELVRHAIISRLRRPLPLALALAMPNLVRGAIGITRVPARLEPAVGRHAVQHAAHAVERAADAAPARRVRLGSARRGEGDEERVRLHGERHRARDRDRRVAAVPAAHRRAARPAVARRVSRSRCATTRPPTSTARTRSRRCSCRCRRTSTTSKRRSRTSATRPRVRRRSTRRSARARSSSSASSPVRCSFGLASRLLGGLASRGHGPDQPRDLERARAAVPAVPRAARGSCRCCRSARRSKAPA